MKNYFKVFIILCVFVFAIYSLLKKDHESIDARYVKETTNPIYKYGILVDTFNIYEPQPINTNLIVDSILCYNGQTQAQINVWGGTQPYSYSWSNGDNNFFTTLNAGNHNYTIIDHNGCSYSTTFYISNADSITLQASITNPSCNGFNNGEVIIDITNGGTQPFNFLMTGNSNIQSSNSFNGLSQGNYNYVVTDINGCQNNILATLSDLVIASIFFKFNSLNAKSKSVLVALYAIPLPLISLVPKSFPISGLSEKTFVSEKVP